MFFADTASTNAAGSALYGKSGLAPGNADQRKAAQAVVDYVNAHGGVAGRNVVPRFHQVDTTDVLTPSSRQRVGQRACADWTEDHHVFAMMDVAGGETLGCALSTRTVVVADILRGIGWLSESMFESFHDLWYGPHVFLAERRDRNLVDALWQQGYFERGAKVGIMIEDRPASREGVRRGMIPALARHGIKPEVEIVYPDVVQSPWSNYMLQLQSAGVDHVLWSTTLGRTTAPFFAMKAASDQRYYPKWGFGSDQHPGGLKAAGAPQDQLENTQGMGWLPLLDVGASEIRSAHNELCRRIEEDAAQPIFTAWNYCEVLLFLKFVLDRGAEVSPAGMSAALAGVANEYPSVETVDGLTSLEPDRHDGAAVYRDLTYDSRCAEDGNVCFKYTSEPKRLR